MRRYDFELEVVSPLLMSGASTWDVEWRTPSLRGVFRWWFRVAGGTREDETTIFGGTVRKDRVESSKSGIIRVKTQTSHDSKSIDRIELVNDKNANMSGWNYLTTFLIDKKNDIKKQYYKEGTRLSFSILFDHRAQKEHIKKVLATVWLAFNLGNFGARARRGFGSLQITAIRKNNVAVSNNRIIIDNDGFDFSALDTNNSSWKETFSNQVKACLKIINSSRSATDHVPFKIWTCSDINTTNWGDWAKNVRSDFSQEGIPSRYASQVIQKAPNQPNAVFTRSRDALNWIGWTLMAFRLYRGPEYPTFEQAISGRRGGQTLQLVSERIHFGLPLNFYYSSLKRGGSIKGKGSKGEKVNRRASPLIFKLFKDRKQRVHVLLIQLLDKFVDGGTKFELQEKKPKQRQRSSHRPKNFKVNPINQGKIIEDYIKSLNATQLYP